MLWELDSLGAAAVVCDRETHGKVLGVAGKHYSSKFLSSPQGISVSGNTKILQQNGRVCLTACFGGMLHWNVLLIFNKN